MSLKKMLALLVAVSLVLGVGSLKAMAAEPIKIVQVVDLTGPLEAYAKQSVNGFKLGLEYATKGTMKVLDRPINVIIKDTQAKPDVGKQMLTEAFKDDKADLAVGGVLSSVALAMLPGGQGVQKDTHRRAGRGRFDHR